ncbi:hypothetical protein C6N75_15870 [Streptomyces solincola]|uniref:Uncharacterized protein n=1 Tax=Streptomyces solincola TaxID=2100817 RepID=A0A2S9PV17_9ACTN|nr:hypothetical protein [Streptomyces solincola]PRH78264.1 hypothetical protein C6N75_15870 [Streptomyces solincola]
MGDDHLGTGLPGSPAAAGTLSAAGTIVYAQAGASTDYAVQPTASGARVLAVIKNARAARDYRFPLHLPEGAQAELFEDGTIGITAGSRPDKTLLGIFDKPWARDAHGKDLPTRYELDGDTLVQHIDFTPDTAFPVVADPGWWDQTRFLATCGAAIAGVLLTFVPAGSSIRVVRAVALMKKYGSKKTASIIWRFVNGKRVGSKEREMVKALIGITAISNACSK